MADKQYDVIIVGGGISGYHTAMTARAGSAKLSILIISAEPTLTYSAPSLPDVISGHIPAEQSFVASEREMESKKIEVMLNTRVAAGDADAKTLTLEDGTKLAYDKLVLATGSVPVQLRRMQGTSLPGNCVLKTIGDAKHLAVVDVKRAVVVGTGAIGLEGASSLKERGVEEVTLIEALDWINPKSFDRKASDYMKAELERIGVHVITGEGVSCVEGTDCVTGVQTSQRQIPCELVLWGIGMRPVTDLAAAMGVTLGAAGGITVDDRMHTNLPDVFAVGDCTEPYDLFFRKNMPNMLWRTATEQGQLVGRQLVEDDPEDTYEGAKLLFLTYVGEAVACAYGFTEENLKGQHYTVYEDCQERSYRKVLMQKRKIVGFQMVNTLDGANELYAQMLKDAPVDFDALEVDDPIRFPLKSVALAAYLQQMRSRKV